MPRKKKEVEEAPQESAVEDQAAIEQLLIAGQPQDISPVALRLQLLGLSKEILEHQSHLSWETHTKFVDVSIADIVDGARELLDFVYEEE